MGPKDRSKDSEVGGTEIRWVQMWTSWRWARGSFSGPRLSAVEASWSWVWGEALVGSAAPSDPA